MRSIWSRFAGGLMAMIAMLLPMSMARPRLIKFSQHQFVKRGHAKVLAGGRTEGTLGSWFAAALAVACARLARPAVALAVVALLLLTVGLHAGGAFALATVPVATTRDLKTILGELTTLQNEWRGKTRTAEVIEKFNALAREAKGMQDESDTDALIRDLEAKGREVPNATLPAPSKPSDFKQAQTRTTVAYISLGDFVTLTRGLDQFAASGAKGQFVVDVPAAIGQMRRSRVRGPNGEPLIGLTASEAKAIGELIESKANVSLGTGVLDAQRLPIVPQVTADDRLTLRDVIAQGTTDSTSVEYVRDSGMTRAAAEVAHGSSKPETTMAYTLQTAAVRTIAAWQKVQVQQLQDMPQLRSLIDNRLLYDLAMREEEEIMYGDGVAPNIEGILAVTGTTDIAALTRYAATDDQLLDVIRMGVTEVRRAGYDPNALLIDPLDWEEVELLKDTTKNYLWAVIRDQLGPRVFGLRVVETVAAEQQKVIATQKRSLVVGDFKRGCMLLDRMAAQVLVGLVNDDLIKNLRTILAEERVAFPIFAPKAFAKFTTKAEAT